MGPTKFLLVTLLACYSLCGIATASAPSILLTLQHPDKPVRSVNQAYISFALDNAFVRDPSILPPDQTNSTRIDFNNTLLRTVMPFVKGGYLRVGGTYTDFVHYYVPGTNYTKCPYPNMTKPGAECPGNSFPCCLPLEMSRWKELLLFARDVGVKVVFNLNILHGRWEVFTDTYQHKSKLPVPPWDSSNAKNLMLWTVNNVPPDAWPVAYGLGNELQWFFTPQQWAHDVATLHGVVKSVFAEHGSIPSLYAPCNANGASIEWGGQFLDEFNNMSEGILGAFTFHGYQHSGCNSEDIGNMKGGIDASGGFYGQVAAVHQQHGPRQSELWITETAWSASAPPGAPSGGDKADVDGMLRAGDVAWYLDALGSAALVGVDVFCKETLAGDWLETIGLWQHDSNPVYTPHPDFWVAALWNKLMDVQVLNVSLSNMTVHTKIVKDKWLVAEKSSSCFNQEGPNGTENIPLLGSVNSIEECEALCEQREGCKSCSWADTTVGKVWALKCFGRMDDVWELTSHDGVTSACDQSRGPCVPPPPPPPQIRSFAHCSKNTKDGKTVTFAIAAGVSLLPQGIQVNIAGAEKLVVYALFSNGPADDWLLLNGKNITATSSLEGLLVNGDTYTLPPHSVGFIEATFASPVQACSQQS
eukprot:m.131086 g.131086  ORF g.131086 m.131086 type:complete len:643 (-) comp14613_c0_seq6:48-1976(-)